MADITFQCYACNQRLRVGADKGGKKTKCLKCGTVLTIPVAAVEPEVLSPEMIEEPAPPPTRLIKPQPNRPAEDFRFDREEARPTKRRPRDESSRKEEAEEDRPRKRRRDEDDQTEAPRKRRREEADEDADDRPRKRISRGEDEEERPRKRRSQVEDEVEQPRKKRRDEDEERPRRRHAEEDEEDEEDSERGREKKTDWDKVGLGMLVCFIAVIVFAAGYLIEQLGVVMFTMAAFENTGQEIPTSTAALNIWKIAVWILPLGVLGSLAGQVFWIFTNNKRSALIWAFACLGVTLAALVCFVVFKSIGLYQGRVFYGPDILREPANLVDANIGRALLLSLANVFVAGQFIMMALYLRAQALNQRDSALAGSAMILVVFSGIVAVYQLLWPILTSVVITFRAPTRGPLAVSWIIYWIGALLTLLLLVVMIVGMKRGHRMASQRMTAPRTVAR
ncbi:MAG: hypothetical protein HY040_04110 [Planctomycetes bacterium]|nr:hypothetical protein [Planctomycetota bacterium]